MNYVVYKLISPRPTFPQDMTEAEGRLMLQHVAYWNRLLETGQAVVFGPVADPAGPYGLAVLELDEGHDPRALAAGDPVITANVGFSFDVHPMLSAVARPYAGPRGRGRV